ncbi:MAG: hypothetical protein MZV70_06665 [Desulfobacterales bacterium]|nr:hypothetical protein [Desulfobacterales bacterium]
MLTRHRLFLAATRPTSAMPAAAPSVAPLGPVPGHGRLHVRRPAGRPRLPAEIGPSTTGMVHRQLRQGIPAAAIEKNAQGTTGR